MRVKKKKKHKTKTPLLNLVLPHCVPLIVQVNLEPCVTAQPFKLAKMIRIRWRRNVFYSPPSLFISLIVQSLKVPSQLLNWNTKQNDKIAISSFSAKGFYELGLLIIFQRHGIQLHWMTWHFCSSFWPLCHKKWNWNSIYLLDPCLSSVSETMSKPEEEKAKEKTVKSGLPL